MEVPIARIYRGGGDLGDLEEYSTDTFSKKNRFVGKWSKRYYRNYPPPENWSRLKGGRRERYYQPTASKEALGQHDTNALRGGVDEAKLVPPQWDVAPPEEFFDELFRVSKNQIIWGGNYFSLPPTRCFLIWRKLSIGEQFSMAMCEYAWTSFKGNAKLFECTPQRNKHSGKFHPTEKPQDLYAWIYQNFVKEG